MVYRWQSALLQRGHLGGKHCKANITQNQQQDWNEAVAGAQAGTLTVDGILLKKVKHFKYLGRSVVGTLMPGAIYESCQGAKALYLHLYLDY